MRDDSQQLFIYVDASYSREAQLAVLGFFTTEQSPVFLEVTETNNIRAELRGVIWALESCLKEQGAIQVVLYTDCQTVSGLLQRRARLEASQFLSKSKNKPLANMDLYKEFYKIYDLIQPKVVWVRGHTSRSMASQVEKNFSTLDKMVRQRLRQRLDPSLG